MDEIKIDKREFKGRPIVEEYQAEIKAMMKRTDHLYLTLSGCQPEELMLFLLHNYGSLT